MKVPSPIVGKLTTNTPTTKQNRAEAIDFASRIKEKLAGEGKLRLRIQPRRNPGRNNKSKSREWSQMHPSRFPPTAIIIPSSPKLCKQWKKKRLKSANVLR
jgi:hypothetical protein